jgi:Flp pilus assembly protein TadB
LEHLDQLERLQIQRTKDFLSFQHPWAAGQKAAGQKAAGQIQKAARQKAAGQIQKAAGQLQKTARQKELQFAGQKKLQKAAAAVAAASFAAVAAAAAVCATGLNVDKQLYYLNLDTEMASVATTSGMC